MRKMLALCAVAAWAMISSIGLSASAAPGKLYGSIRGGLTSASDWKAEPEECAFLTLINDYRVEKGLSKLTISLTLSAAAEHHSVDMGKNNYFSHTLFDGTTWSQNIADHGYPTNTTRAENLAAGRESAAGVFDQWKNSSGHNANMLNGKFTAIGIGRYKQSGSKYTWYWTNTFGSKVDKSYTCSGQSAGSPSELVIDGGGRSSSSTSSLLAFDGDTSTSWYTTKSTVPRTAYVYFDLGTSAYISSISWYFNKNGSADSFSVEISSDKSTWTTITTRTSPKAGSWQSSKIAKKARYVRFYFKNPNNDPVLGYLAEVKLYP